MKKYLENNPQSVAAVISAVMLLFALDKQPYGYYTLLRLVVCASAAFVAFMGYSGGKIWIAWLFGFIALLFNPLIKVHLDRDTWAVIDFICAVLFVASLFLVRLPTLNKKNSRE